jgi:hypothetical protein
MLESTSKFQVERIIYQTHNFAIAIGKWEQEPRGRAACRWYDANGLGYPQTYGKPQWFQLPPTIEVDIVNAIEPTQSEVVIRFKSE